MKEVNKIQNVCKEAMNLWGYIPIKGYPPIQNFKVKKNAVLDQNFRLKS